MEKKAKEFIQLRNGYQEARMEQRTIIERGLEKKYICNMKGTAGRGSEKYKSGKKINPSFNLNNWIWLEAETIDTNTKEEKVKIFISFQAFDQDPNTKNYHALYDRLGYVIYDEKAVTNFKGNENQYLTRNMKISRFTLPLMEDELGEFVKFIDEKVAEYRLSTK